jgi:3-dehydroquinate synthetase
MGVCDTALEQRQREALEAFGLPVQLPAEAEASALLVAARSDKKVRQQRINWVLPVEIGMATARGDVPDEIVLEALQECGAA